MGLFDIFKRALFKQEPKRSPWERQIKLYGRLGLTLPINAGPIEAQQFIDEALKRPEVRARFDQIEAERKARHEREAAEWERQDREQYGDQLVDELKQWEARCVRVTQYLAVWRKGKSAPRGDVVEVDAPGPSIEGEKIYSIKIPLLVPRIYKERETADCIGGEHVEWKKELTVTGKQILHWEPLEHRINDSFDIAAYRAAKARAEAIASRLL